METNHRRCITCRRTAHRSHFLRIVRDHQTHQVLLNSGMGRSAYLCPSTDCIKQAQRKNRLSKVLKSQVQTSVYDLLFRQIDPSSSHET